MKELKQSNTTTIKRSQINLNPYNPKVHTEDKVRMQRKNLQNVGFLGGIVWNKATGNLIDGHRRIQAMDAYYKYDGTVETDYSVKIESVELDTKAEKEQMAYMALGNTKADLDLVSKFIGDIDYEKAGITNDEYDEIKRRCIVDIGVLPGIESIDIFNDYQSKSYEEKKAAVKEVKAAVKEKAIQNALNQESYITISFTDFQTKAMFCEIIGADPYTTKFIKGEELLQAIE